MLKKLLSLILVCGLLNLGSYAAAKDAEFEAKVKAEVAKLGTGQHSIVKIKLRDKTEVKDYISEITDNDFSVVNEKTGALTKVTYPHVKQIRGRNNLNGKSILLTAVIIGVIALVAALSLDD